MFREKNKLLSFFPQTQNLQTQIYLTYVILLLLALCGYLRERHRIHYHFGTAQNRDQVHLLPDFICCPSS